MTLTYILERSTGVAYVFEKRKLVKNDINLEWTKYFVYGKIMASGVVCHYPRELSLYIAIYFNYLHS